MTTPSKRRGRGVPEASSPEAHARMVRQPRAATAPERALAAALEARGLVFETQAQVLPTFRRRADVVLRASRVAVFVDGCFWHGCPTHATHPRANAAWWQAKLEANQRRDRATDDALRAAGWTVVRVWEHEPADEAAARIVELLDAALSELEG